MNVSHLLVKKSFFLFEVDFFFRTNNILILILYGALKSIYRFVKEKFLFLCVFNDALFFSHNKMMMIIFIYFFSVQIKSSLRCSIMEKMRFEHKTNYEFITVHPKGKLFHKIQFKICFFLLIEFAFLHLFHSFQIIFRVKNWFINSFLCCVCWFVVWKNNSLFV